MRRSPLTLAVLLLTAVPACSGACGSGIEPAPAPEEPARTPVVETKAAAPVTEAAEPDDGPGPYECEKDEDCGLTCGGGAMNNEWFMKHGDKVPGCKDGCAGKGSGKAVCIDGGCVALDREGNVNEYCTRKLEDLD